ncbi:bifunctional DNA-formamidopyrimidine glycosylase/DNA-(apurinic or apyrimidinic site) lyase [Candidatus Saccharibacteria bacterium]|nr:bifunctional DNA-formamidopyrimidine glycosylase/DNA-(apurinic or apyrimidinic site) lyase [Candidatus Saccharibacteria bacterium]
MPELPEVETIRRGLNKFILKESITSTDVLCEKSFIGTPITGTVISIRRFGKALVIDLDNQQSLMIHLRMTGQLIYDGKSRYAAGHPSDNFTADLPNRQTRVVLHFKNGTLYFNDQRKFGFIKVLPTSEVEKDSFIKKLAKEPWDMTSDEFYDKLQKHPHSCIKATILDQSIITGLGNIYADEALFASRIHPERRSGTLTRQEADLLLESARAVMDRSIESGGSTMATYVKADGTKGDYLELFAQVFRREGKPCPRCGTEIIKIKVAGRGTHVCPHCQKKEQGND